MSLVISVGLYNPEPEHSAVAKHVPVLYSDSDTEGSLKSGTPRTIFVSSGIYILLLLSK